MDLSDRKTFAEIMTARHEEMKRNEEEARAWSQRVTEQLHNEQSAFLKDFTEAEARILGLK